MFDWTLKGTLLIHFLSACEQESLSVVYLCKFGLLFLLSSTKTVSLISQRPPWLGAYWMEEQRKWSSSFRDRNGICQNCIYVSGIIFPSAVPKPHLSGELVGWSRAFLRPGVSSGFASYKTRFSHPLADNWQKQISSHLWDPKELWISCTMFVWEEDVSKCLGAKLQLKAVTQQRFFYGTLLHGLDAEGRDIPVVLRCEKVHSTICSSGSAVHQKSRKTQMLKSCMEEKTQNTLMWYQGPAALWW